MTTLCACLPGACHGTGLGVVGAVCRRDDARALRDAERSPVPTPIVVATMDSEHYAFVAAGRDEAEARVALHATLDAHRDTGAWAEMTNMEVEEHYSARFDEVRMGEMGTRDGVLLHPRWRIDMTRFLDGPGAGNTFDCARAPRFIRLVIDTAAAKTDVLDLVADTPREGELVYVYEAVPGTTTRMHICIRGKGKGRSGWYESADYRHRAEIDGELLRDTEAWQAWAQAQPTEVVP